MQNKKPFIYKETHIVSCGDMADNGDKLKRAVDALSYNEETSIALMQKDTGLSRETIIKNLRKEQKVDVDVVHGIVRKRPV